MASFYDLIMGQRLPQQEGAAGYSNEQPPYVQFPLWQTPGQLPAWPPGHGTPDLSQQYLPDELPPNAFDMWGQGDMPVIHPWMIWPERYGLPGNRRP